MFFGIRIRISTTRLGPLRHPLNALRHIPRKINLTLQGGLLPRQIFRPILHTPLFLRQPRLQILKLIQKFLVLIGFVPQPMVDVGVFDSEFV